MKWEKIPWFDGVEEKLSSALLDDLIFIKAEVDSGVANLWRIENYGYFVTRLEKFGEHQELVLVAFQGKKALELIEHLKSVCKNQGIQSMRFHTGHPEKLMSRFIKPTGFKRYETVYRLEL